MKTSSSTVLNPQLDLETAIMTACGLIDLLTEELLRQRERQGGDEIAGQCAAGILNLSQRTMAELGACYDAAFEEHRQLCQKSRTQHGKV
jgi:hypothetical protein